MNFSNRHKLDLLLALLYGLALAKMFHDIPTGAGGGEGGYSPLQEANWDVPLDGVAFSRLK